MKISFDLRWLHGTFLLKTPLGGGQFCYVWEGVWNGTTGVAVKYGLCTQEEPIYMVMELMKHGSLLEYLRGDSCSLKFLQLIDMAAQVAAGMAYLEQNGCIHQNLGAKNVLLSDTLKCKVDRLCLSSSY